LNSAGCDFIPTLLPQPNNSIDNYQQTDRHDYLNFLGRIGAYIGEEKEHRHTYPDHSDDQVKGGQLSPFEGGLLSPGGSINWSGGKRAKQYDRIYHSRY